MLILLIIILVNSLQFWVDGFNTNFPTNVLSFYLASMIAIVTVLGRWIDGRIKAIIRSINIIGGQNGRKRKG